MTTSLECNKFWYRPDKMAGLGRLSWKQSTSRWKKNIFKEWSWTQAPSITQPPLFSSHQQSKHSQRLTTTGDSSPREPVDKLKLGQPPWRRSSGDLPDHELTVHKGYLCFQALLPDSLELQKPPREKPKENFSQSSCTRRSSLGRADCGQEEDDFSFLCVCQIKRQTCTRFRLCLEGRRKFTGCPLYQMSQLLLIQETTLISNFNHGDYHWDNYLHAVHSMCSASLFMLPSSSSGV